MATPKNPNAKPSPKRKTLADVDVNAAPRALSSPAPLPKRPKLGLAPKHKPNIGGASKMSWLNELMDNPKLRPALNNLLMKINRTKIADNGSLQIIGKDEWFRPQIDKRLREEASKICPDLPERFAPYHVSLVYNNQRVPSANPPLYPPELRKSKKKHIITTALDNGKEAYWVASHLCHNRCCIQPRHLEWEPSWMNRLRDNCPGGDICVHRPRQCIAPHRRQDELINWTRYWKAEGTVESANIL